MAAHRPDASAPGARPDASVTRHEEELLVATEPREVGSLRIEKRIEEVPVADEVRRGIEQADVETAAPAENDSGEVEVLSDGSVSVPVFEEELVISKRLVVRERLIIRKHTVSETDRVETTLRRERVDIEEVSHPPTETSR